MERIINNRGCTPNKTENSSVYILDKIGMGLISQDVIIIDETSFTKKELTKFHSIRLTKILTHFIRGSALYMRLELQDYTQSDKLEDLMTLINFSAETIDRIMSSVCSPTHIFYEEKAVYTLHAHKIVPNSQSWNAGLVNTIYRSKSQSI